MGRESVAWAFFYMMNEIFAAALQIVVIYSYFRLDKKFSDKASSKVLDELR